jgi:ABC-type dipeptide/oligopeptide/nickel transport system permease subunit
MSGVLAAPFVRRGEPPTAATSGNARRLIRSPSGRAGLLIAAALIIGWAVGSLLTASGSDVDLANKLAAPGGGHPLGTDQFGRDELARLCEGGLRSIGAAALVLAGVLVISLTVGVIAGMTGGIIDIVLMRIVDVLLAFPALVLALAVVGVLGPGFENVLLALIASAWAYYARLARSYVLTARLRPDVIAARAAGIGWPRAVAGHVIPCVATQLLVVATLTLGEFIIAIAGLSFVGLGVQPPTPEWGSMLNDSRLYFETAPWLLAAPALAILLAVSAANLIGDALRDITDTTANG